MPPQEDNNFIIEFSQFYQGFAPAAHLNSLTELGNKGHASVMQNADVLTPDYVTQGPALADLTNGNQSGVVDQLIMFIMDKPVASAIAYALGTGKMFRISSTTVKSGGTPSWPQTVTNMVNSVGFEPSLVYLKANVYGFYNKASGGDILKMPVSGEVIDPDWGSTTPTGFAALQKAKHPSAAKEDIIAFGNGRYLGTYIVATNTLAPTKLDFGNNHEVADVIFHANQWLIGVNGGVSGSQRNESQVYLYDGSAVSSILSDETAVGLYKIGFLYALEGIIYIAYQDLSSTGGYKIGYISGRRIIPLASFTGALPGYHQKTLYKNTILFVASALIWSVGAVIPDLPVQVSQLADGGHSTVGALAAPFGTPIVASTQSTNYRLAKFSGYETSSNWKSIVVPVIRGNLKGYIDRIVVLTNNLGANARCDLDIEYNQAQSTLDAVKQIKTTNKRMHDFYGSTVSIKSVEDIRIFLDWSNGSATNPCNIRKILVMGHFV